jgi:hypothetical protein
MSDAMKMRAIDIRFPKRGKLMHEKLVCRVLD